MANVFRNKYPLLDSLIYNEGNKWGDYYLESERQKLREQYTEFLSTKNELLGNIVNYVDCRLHDSWVINTNYNYKELEITLNEFSSHCFADVVVEEFGLNIPHKKRVLPVSLKFKNIKKISISWVNKNSKIIPIKTEKFITRLSEFLYEQIITLEKNKIEIGLLFWSGMKGKKSYLLLEIECEHLVVNEFQEEEFRKLFGEKHLLLFKKFWEEKQKGKYFDYSTAKEII